LGRSCGFPASLHGNRFFEWRQHIVKGNDDLIGSALDGYKLQERIYHFNDGRFSGAIDVDVNDVIWQQLVEINCERLRSFPSTALDRRARPKTVRGKDGVKSSTPTLEGNLVPIGFETYDSTTKPSTVMKTFAFSSALERHFESCSFTYRIRIMNQINNLPTYI
jgi:hypothetical protein